MFDTMALLSSTLSCAVLSHFSHVLLFATPWTVSCQAPLPMRFSRQESWSRFPCPPPGDLPDPGMEPASPASAGRFFTTRATWEGPVAHCQHSSTGVIIVCWMTYNKSLSLCQSNICKVVLIIVSNP